MQKQKCSMQSIIKHWQYIASIVCVPKNDKEFNELAAQLDALLDFIDGDENHPIMSLVDVISNIIENYESQKYHKKSKARGIDALKFLMQNHNLKQSDLAKIASQGVMSEILSGKRKLNLRQIRLLAKHFSVNLETFID